MGDTGDHIGDLARKTSTVPLFTSLLDQAAFIASLGRQGATDSSFLPFTGNGNMQNARDNVQIPPFKPLPPVFMLQIDNSAKDNKNIHVLAFCSELVIRGVFETEETNHGTGFTLTQRQQEITRDGPEDGIIVVDKLQQELHQENNLMLQPYVGDPANRPRRSFIPLEDITKGKFVILRPDDAFEAENPRMIWLGRAMGAVVREVDDEHHGQFLVEWWRPKHQKLNATNKERYLNVLVG
ncbi:hypothetical protein R1sor_021596 [Riccia sorocarpa]|uniref:DUF7869 domain-containing protein n=1 Tax=Riccia sorocarpa TaxID=122646 RepID=A0ABD3GKU1_9MARC